MTLQEILWFKYYILGIFVTVIIIIFGYRMFANMFSFDFAPTIAVGSFLALLFFIYDYFFLVKKNNFVKKLCTNNSQINMWKGKLLYNRLEQCHVGLDNLFAKLSAVSIHNYDEEVKALT